MTFFERYSIERKLRVVHGWLGAVILPWIVLAGLTGFYMNHEKLVLSVFPQPSEVSPEDYADTAHTQPVESASEAIVIAMDLANGAALALDSDDDFRGRPVYTFKMGRDEIIVDRNTAFVWLRERYRTTYFAPSGEEISSELRWSRILSSLHQRGWVGTRLGTWLSDITAIALVAFGLSGIVLFYAPRMRRRKNRRARMRSKSATMAQVAKANRA